MGFVDAFVYGILLNGVLVRLVHIIRNCFTMTTETTNVRLDSFHTKPN
jgi:hypothetical protein